MLTLCTHCQGKLEKPRVKGKIAICGKCRKSKDKARKLATLKAKMV